ncbi:ABC transporter permease [Auritidibacter ignavus]|uniref:ABC transporter permease n=1 Tax=Auritidibacter ignavus TaxID=678932 RepID=UPI0024489DF4|nr:ABC transporter permease [Auritidibacter ignavus]WGH84087.1 ABC transporter permease [Auritidibacter ignavus]WHS35136.1 ABC transporter permease [Auritidibacter ignavus]
MTQTLSARLPRSSAEPTIAQRSQHNRPPQFSPKSITSRIGLILAGVFLALVVIAAFFPGVLAPGDPYQGDTNNVLQSPSLAHWFGTDHLGRDLFTRVVHGTSLSLQTALMAVVIAFVSGSFFGVLSGFLAGVVDQVIMRIVDVLLAIPSLLLSLALISALGFGSLNVAIAVAVGSVATFARIARSESLKVSGADYVDAARSVGSSRFSILVRHVLPNASGPIIALAVLEFGNAILAVSALSFLGFGAPKPAPEWGALVSEGRNYLYSASWLTLLPGLVVAATVLSVHVIARRISARKGV